MPVTSIDPIAAFTPPPRAVEAPRASDVDRPFAPALAQAYKDDRPKEVRPAKKDDPPKAEDKAPPVEAKPVESRHEESGKRSDNSQAPPETDAKPANRDEHDEKPQKDSSDISDEGAAAAAAASDGKPVKEVQATVEKTLLVEQAKAAKAKAQAQAEQQEGAAKATGETEGSKDANAEKLPAAKDEQSPGDKKQQPIRNSKATSDHAGAEIQVAHAAAANTKAVTGAAAQAGQPAVAAKAEVTETASQPKKPKAARETDSVLADQPKADVAQTPVVQKADQAAATVQAVAAPQIQLTKESAKVDASAKPKTEAISSHAGMSKHSATLERLAARTMRTGEGESPNNSSLIDKNRFVQRVEGAIRAAQQRDGRIHVRLSPPELGNLRIELAVQNGVMHAKLEAETPAARNALLDNLPALRDRLAQQDIRVEKFEVDIRRDTNGGSSGGQTFDRPSGQPHSGRQEGRPRPPAPRTSTVVAAPQSIAGGRVSDTALDIRI